MDEHDCKCCGGRFAWDEDKETHTCDSCGIGWNDDEHLAAVVEVIEDSTGDGTDRHAF
jgi:hypothetical protein